MGRLRSRRFVELAARRSRRASRDALRRRLAAGQHESAAAQPAVGTHGEPQGAAPPEHEPVFSSRYISDDDDGSNEAARTTDTDLCDSCGLPSGRDSAEELGVDTSNAAEDSVGDVSVEQSTSSLEAVEAPDMRATPTAVEADVLPEYFMASPSAGGEPEGNMLVEEPALGARRGPIGQLPVLPLPMPFKVVEHLYAYLLLRGQCHGTEELYEVVRAGMNIRSPVPLPAANTIRYNISPVVDASWLLPTRTLSTRHLPTGKVVNVRYIAPSEHVRRDLLFDATFELFKKADERTELDRSLHPEFVDSPMFQDRASVLMTGRFLRQFILGGVQFSVGNHVSASFAGGRSLSNIKIKRAFFAASQSGLPRDQAAHAGDFVVECDNVVNQPETAGYFVCRHWYAASLPLLTWHTIGNGVEEVLELRRVGSAGLPSGPGGGDDAAAADPAQDVDVGAPSTRRMMWDRTGDEASLIVSLCVYSDGFGTQAGKEVTLGGVYMSYASWLFRDRCSSHAARTISVTPSGVDSDCVLEAITEDLRQGARDGWLCRCADGTTVRVWADISFFVGDYVQVAKTSNMMGPAANSPCTLCTYRLHGAPGCRFGLSGSSMSTELMRTSNRTRSVCLAARAWPERDNDE